MAKAVAEEISNQKKPLMLLLGAGSTPEKLFGETRLVDYLNINDDRDQRTEFSPGPILQWANSTNPPVLILEEANLAAAGLLSPLAGLLQQPPALCYRGEHYPLTEKHRIILTGNPDSYEGRHLDITLKSSIPTLFYHSLPDDEVQQSIIMPRLPIALSTTEKKQVYHQLMTLFNQFQKLVTDAHLTSRDINDVLSTMELIIRCNGSTNLWNENKINTLVSKAFMDSLSGSLSESQHKKLTTLNLWFQGQFPQDFQ